MILALLLACSSPPSPPPVVHLDGCEAAWPGRCLRDGPVTVWVDERGLEARFDGEVAPWTWDDRGARATGDGRRVEVLRGREVVWAADLEAWVAPVWRQNLQAVARGTAPLPDELSLEARVAFGKALLRRDPTAASALLEGALAEIGERTDLEVDARMSLAWRQVFDEDRPNEGLRTLASAPEPVDVVQAAMLHTVRGQAARQLGQLREADHAFADAGRLASRTDGPRTAYILSERGELLQWSGNVEGALAAHGRAVSLADEDCARAALRSNLAWALWLAGRDAYDGESAVAIAELGLDREGCAARDVDARIHLALHAAASGDLARGRALREGLLGEELGLAQRLAVAELGALVADPMARAEATETWLALAEQVDDLHHQWRARELLARLRYDAGEVDTALAILSVAADLASEHAAAIPFEVGRGAFLVDQARITRLRATWLAERGRWADALDVTRGWRAWPAAHVWHGLAQRELAGASADTAVERFQVESGQADTALEGLWALSAGERAHRLEQVATTRRRARGALEETWAEAPRWSPRPPEPGELFLGRLDDCTWVARSARGVTPLGHDCHGVPRPELEGVEVVSLLPGSVGQAPAWIRDVPVRWTTDLEATAEPVAVTRALVVSDPRGDLRGAREEGRAVAATLRARGVDVEELRGPAATRGAVLERLDRGVDLLHVAAHAERDGVTGAAELQLADGSVLGTTDVFAARAPSLVVLSACDSGAVVAGGVDLGTAWISKGTAAVVTTHEDVDDAAAARFVSALYAAGFGERTPHDAFQAAAVGAADAARPYRLMTP